MKNSFEKKQIFKALKIIVVPLCVVYILLFFTHKPIESFSKKIANQLYQVKSENNYSNEDEYLTAVERQKLLAVLPVWSLVGLLLMLTFFISIRPKLLILMNKFEEPEKLKLTKKSDSWKPVYTEIKSIFNEWDPLSVAEEGIKDEYDSFALQVAGKVIHGRTLDDIENYLNYVFLEEMGLKIPEEEIETYAKRFILVGQSKKISK